MNGRWQWRGVPKPLRYHHRGSRKLNQPTVEVLEPRQLLSVSWISKTSGNWNVASNWSTDTVPGPGDDVVIDYTGASPTVTISSNVESVNSITADDPLVISGGGLTVAADSTISGGLSMTGGTLNGSGTLTVASAFDWTGGDLDGAGTTTVASGGTLNIGGSSTKYLTGGHILNNEGSGTWSGTGEFDGSPGSTFNNMGTFTALSDANFGNGGQGAGVIFNNSGIFTKSGTSGTTSFSDNILNNSGTVNVESGTLSLNAGSATQIETGTFNVASGSSLDIENYFGGSGGDVQLNEGTTFNGSGLYELDLGTLTVNTPISVANFTMTSGFQNGPATLTVTSALNWSGGDLDGNGTTTVPSSATMSLIGPNTKYLTGGHILNNEGSATWSGIGEFDGSPGSTFNNMGTFTALSDANFGNGGQGAGVIFNNSGTFTKSGTTGTTTFSGNLLNNSGTVNIDSGTLSINAGSATQIETGTFNVASGASFDIDNYFGGSGGPVLLNEGTQLRGSGLYELDLGTITVNANLSIANLTMTGGVLAAGSGTFLSIANLTMTGGTLVVGAGATFDFSGGLFQWAGGAINGAGGTLINKGTINLTGSSDKLFYNDGTLDDYGTIVQTGTGNLALHSDNQEPTVLNIESGGSYLIESDSGVSNDYGGETQINNSGVIEKTAGTGTSTILVNGTLSNTGTIEADSGTLSLAATIAQISQGALTAGTWNAESGATLEFPSGTSITTNEGNITLDGAGATIAAISGLSSSSGSFSLASGASFTTSGDFGNTGTLTIGAGSTLTVNGNYSQGSAGSLTIGIGGATSGNEYGQLNVAGSATLAGSVNASTASGFTPSAGASFPIVTYASETGGDSMSFTGVNSGAVSILQPVVGPTNIVLTTVTSPANLVVQAFSVAANAVAGQNLTVTYQVDNDSSNAASGSWTDSVYLSTQPTLNANSVLLGRVQHTGGVAADGQYSETLTAPVPGLAPNDYYVVVLADSLGLVPELNRTSTELASTNPLQVTLPTLDLGSPISGTIEDGQSLYYQLAVPAGQDVAISAGFAALQGGELYVGYQGIPSSSTSLASSTSPTQTTHQVVIPDTQAGTYDILVQGDTGSGSGQPFTLSAQALPLQVTGVGPAQAGNGGTTTLTIQGAEFTSAATVSLVPHGGGTSIAASQVTFQGSTTLFAQFNLAGAAPGSYDLVVTDGAQKATDPSAFTVTSNVSPGQISYNLSVPSISRPGRIAYLTLRYSNDGGSNALAPLFVVSVTSGNATIGLPGETSFSGSSVQILGIESTGPAGTLPPGYQGTLLIPYESTTLVAGASIDFSLQVMSGDSTPMNWSSLESSLQPSYMSATAWSAVFANLTASFGSTTETYLAALDNEATYLSQLGEYTDDVQRLFGFAINLANDAATSGSLDSVTDASFPVPGAIPLDFVRQMNNSISGRDTMGPFGLGWTDNWQISASADSNGNVTISDDGSLLYFAKQSDGSYLDAPGEYGTLTLVSGAYQYVQTDGTIIAFNTNGTLNYEQDTNSNRITAGYNSSGELTSLTASNGSAISIQYNAQGLISQITDPAGQSTTYTYDASGQHLLTFTDEFGKTTYTYATGPTAADANALTSITYADGTGIQYTYDALGRLATEGRLGGAETETYAYPAPGEVTVTNADDDTTAIFHDDQGNLGTLIDPLGNITRYTYDVNDNLIKVVAADGTTTTYSYDANGDMTSETDPLGYKIEFTYNSLAEPLTFVNQEGYATSYEYDANGNLLEAVNPEGTTQQYVYNALGEVTSSTDADGQTITFAYNTNGQLTTENLPDGTSDTYTYDSHGNMLTADGPGGNWSFNYNSQNLPTTIVEPNGTLTVQYGIDGNITQIVDQIGFTVNYLYDSVGRLSELTDGSGNLIESYTYDPAGNVISETKGNGTSTTYQYNADGAITEITNLAPGGATNSQIAYTYGALGQVASMTTGGVTTTYGYDADGELTSASSPGDTILYAYDPDGNRTSVTDNGVVTDYTSNSIDEYTQVGDTSYQYDANGNLIAATTNGQTTTYTFNALNQLTGVSGPTGTYSYTYDALGYQISSTVNGQTTNNLIDPFGMGNVAAQFGSSGNLIAHYTYGLGLVSQVSASGTAYYYDYNLQGSTVGITNTAGVYVNQYSYDPFGQVTTISAGIANSFTFDGLDGVSNDGNGLMYMRGRYYAPGVGDFVSQDPLGLDGGDTNVERYAGNDPILFVDPEGLRSWAESKSIADREYSNSPFEKWVSEWAGKLAPGFQDKLLQFRKLQGGPASDNLQKFFNRHFKAIIHIFT